MMTEETAPRIVVLGSVHMDLIARAARLPAPGENVGGGTFFMSPGGKGGNQACQCALAGARTSIVTRLGTDDFGRRLAAALGARGVDVSHITWDDETPTGASTVLAAAGDYASIIAPGAAAGLCADDIEQASGAIASAGALILQLELPAAISAQAAGVAVRNGTGVILNASPAPSGWDALPATLRNATSTLITNRVEAERLSGRRVGPAHLEGELGGLAAQFGVQTLVMTLGADGAAAHIAGAFFRQPAFAATVTDAVGAGDAFLGAFGVAMLDGVGPADALRRGAAAGALAVSRAGAHDALPSRSAIDAFLGARPPETGVCP